MLRRARLDCLLVMNLILFLIADIHERLCTD